MIISSDMDLILKELNQNIIEKLNILSEMTNLEIFKVSSNITET